LRVSLPYLNLHFFQFTTSLLLVEKAISNLGPFSYVVAVPPSPPPPLADRHILYLKP